MKKRNLKDWHRWRICSAESKTRNSLAWWQRNRLLGKKTGNFAKDLDISKRQWIPAGKKYQMLSRKYAKKSERGEKEDSKRGKDKNELKSTQQE